RLVTTVSVIFCLLKYSKIIGGSQILQSSYELVEWKFFHHYVPTHHPQTPPATGYPVAGLDSQARKDHNTARVQPRYSVTATVLLPTPPTRARNLSSHLCRRLARR